MRNVCNLTIYSPATTMRVCFEFYYWILVMTGWLTIHRQSKARKSIRQRTKQNTKQLGLLSCLCATELNCLNDDIRVVNGSKTLSPCDSLNWSGTTRIHLTNPPSFVSWWRNELTSASFLLLLILQFLIQIADHSLCTWQCTMEDKIVYYYSVCVWLIERYVWYILPK